MSATAAPSPSVRVHLDLTIPEMHAICDAYMAYSRAQSDRIATSEPTWAATLEHCYTDEAARWSELITSVTFVSMISTDKARRDAAFDIEQKLSEFGIEQFMRTDVYKNLCELHKRVESGEEVVTPEQHRILGRMVRARARAGLGLDNETREKLTALQTRISELATNYTQAIQDANPELLFTAEELAGVPEGVLASLDRTDDGKYRVHPKEYPHLIPIMEYCDVRETRASVHAAANTLAPENIDRLAEIVRCRAQVATILGFESHADHVLQEMMVTGPQEVTAFLASMRGHLGAAGKVHAQELIKLADTLPGAGEGVDGRVANQDRAYLLRIDSANRYGFDAEEIRPYLPSETIVPDVINLIAGLNGFTTKRLPTKVASVHEGAERSVDDLIHDNHSLVCAEDGTFTVWNEDTDAYAIYNDGELIGYLICDLYPHPGTYGHACCCDTVAPFSRIAADGTKVSRVAVASLCCNFTPSTPSAPSHLTHDELETLCHELGHAFHLISSQSELDDNNAFHIESDAIELPSQAMEGIAWTPGALRVLTRSAGEELPEELAKQLVASRQAGQALAQLRQISLATVDMDMHMKCTESVVGEELETLYNQIVRDVALTEPMANAGCMLTNFGHLVGGYDARYYSYMYSNVVAADAWNTIVERAGGDTMEATSPEEYAKHLSKGAKSWQHEVLRVGATRKAKESISAFLGREPSPEALLKIWGVWTE